MDLGLLLAVAATILLGMALRNIRATTLFAPWCWLLVTLWSIALTHTLGGDTAEITNDPSGRSSETLLESTRHQYWIEAMQFAAHALVFCPFMSLLGARRPQNRMWEFIVFSLWLILILPAFETMLLHPGQLPDIESSMVYVCSNWYICVKYHSQPLLVQWNSDWCFSVPAGRSQPPNWTHQIASCQGGPQPCYCFLT